MKCNELIERLYAHTDGELSTQEEIDIRAHLGGCRLCASLVKEQEILIGKFRDSLKEDVNCPDIASMLRPQLVRPSLAISRRCARTWIYRATACAAALLIAVVSMWFVSQRRPNQVTVKPNASDLHMHASHPPLKKQANVPDRLQLHVVPRAQVEAPMPVVPRRQCTLRVSDSKQRSGEYQHAKYSSKYRHEFRERSAQKMTLPTVTVIQVPSDCAKRITRITATLVVAGGIKVSRSLKNVAIPLPPNADAELIQRPPLKVITTQNTDASES